MNTIFLNVNYLLHFRMIEVESLIETIATADETASEVFDAEKRAPSVPLYIPPWKTTVISSLVENKA